MFGLACFEWQSRGGYAMSSAAAAAAAAVIAHRLPTCSSTRDSRSRRTAAYWAMLPTNWRRVESQLPAAGDIPPSKTTDSIQSCPDTRPSRLNVRFWPGFAARVRHTSAR